MRKTVWVVKEWYVWPIAWLLAGRNYVAGVDAFIERVLAPAARSGRTIGRLHVLSHGNVRRDPASGVPFDRFIDMGSGDRLSLGHFDTDGTPVAGLPTARFLAALGPVMRSGGRLIFSACHQGEGPLLRTMSRALGNDVKVSGYRKIGHPFGRGDVAFRNGLETKP